MSRNQTIVLYDHSGYQVSKLNHLGQRKQQELYIVVLTVFTQSKVLQVKIMVSTKMASSESPQIQVLGDNVGDREQQQVKERTSLLGTNKRMYRAQLFLGRCCIKSKLALLILSWEILVTLIYGYTYESVLVFATDIRRGHRKLENYISQFSYMSFFFFFFLV